MNMITELVREDLREFVPYSSARKEAKNGRVWLDANEAPCELSSNPGQFKLNRYLDQQPALLIAKLADYYAVKQNQLLVTRGSDEGIDLLVRLFCKPVQDAVLICPPTYGMYEVCAKLQGARFVCVPLKTADFSLDLTEIGKYREEGVKLIFLCSPNNPTGNLLNLEATLQLCREFSGKALVVVDEAYIEFAKEPSLSRFIEDYPNLVVLRTLSKAFGLAALRVGALLANAEIIAWLQKILAPYPLSVSAVQIALQAVSAEGLPEMRKQVQWIVGERERMVKNLSALGIVDKIWPSDANFILVQFKCSITSSLQEQGIVLRNMEKRLGTPHAWRITIGTPLENNEVLELLRRA